jgi:hypothetical protein
MCPNLAAIAAERLVHWQTAQQSSANPDETALT